MDGFEADRFAVEWIEAWNSRDIEAVASRFAERCEFRSPRAEEVTGNPIVNGRAALLAYWSKALGQAPQLHFTLDRVIWDGISELVIVYGSERGERRRRACEFFSFDSRTGEVIRGEAMHGASLL
jgi:steroid delta-isomerase